MARRNLSADQQRRLTQQTMLEDFGPFMAELAQAGPLYWQAWDVAPLAKAANNIHASLTLLAAAQAGVITGLANPDVPRNLRVTITLGGGSQFDAGTKVTVYGTDWWGNAISEDFAIDGLATASIVVGARAFATVSKIDYPIRKQANDAIQVGVGDKLGLGVVLRNPLLLRALRGTAAPLTNVENVRAAAVVGANAITDSSTGVDPGNDIIAAVTNPDLSAWNAGTDPTAAQATAIGAAFTAVKAAIAQLAAKLNTDSAALTTLGGTGVLTADANVPSKNTWTPGTIADGANLYRILVLSERS